tara:strand:+ start:57 stop:296 length:240 start_codon:yes stop_codon:yes gene_type:complete
MRGIELTTSDTQAGTRIFISLDRILTVQPYRFMGQEQVDGCTILLTDKVSVNVKETYDQVVDMIRNDGTVHEAYLDMSQ